MVYTLQSYRLVAEHFPLSSLSFLKKRIRKGQSILKGVGNISKDVIVIFDDMFMQKCEEYRIGQTIGADENNDLYKGLAVLKKMWLML